LTSRPVVSDADADAVVVNRGADRGSLSRVYFPHQRRQPDAALEVLDGYIPPRL
jgi:hypothetical protein